MNEKTSSVAGIKVSRPSPQPSKKSDTVGYAIDHTGKKYWHWTVIHRVLPQSQFPNTNTRWLCRCICGTEKVVTMGNIRNGQSQSCGCIARAEGDTHNQGPSDNYRLMIRRCYDPNYKEYPYYGGRGIRVCHHWLEPNGRQNFLYDIAKFNRPWKKGLTLDRLNTDDNYSPANCRWATRKEQALNRRSNVHLTIDGKTLCLSEWAEISGTNYGTMRQRIYGGWTDREVVFGKTQSTLHKRICLKWT